MPRKQLAAVAGRNLLFGPPGSGPSGFAGRGQTDARAATISALGIAPLAEMLFEGGDGVDNVAFDEIRGNTVANDNGAGVIVHGGVPFSFHSVDSIQFNNVDANYVQITINLPTFFVFELWFRDNLTDGDHSAIFGNTDNFRIHTGRGTVTGFNWPSHRNDFNAALSWEPEVDLSSDGLVHQLLEFRDTVGGINYIVCIDGMPVASATLDGGTQLNLKPSFNDRFDAAASERFGGEMGSFVAFDDGGNLTLRDCRELFETSARNGHDMLTAPRWFIIDSSNVAGLDPIIARQVDLGDVLNDTGIRSGAIPRSILGELDGRNTYFELEIIDQGDDATATLIGLRRFAEGGPVGGDPDNPEEAIYLKAGSLFDGANVLIPESDVIGLESGVILDAQMTAKSFDPGGGSWDAFFGRLNDARAWKQALPPDVDDWIQIDLLEVRTITEVRSQGSPIFNEFVETYELEFSIGGGLFTPYNSNEVLTGNSTSGATIVTNILIPFECRFVRLIPKSWTGQPAIRLEYVFAGDQDAQVLGDPITGRVYRFAIPWDEVNPTQFFIGDEATWKGREPAPDVAAGIEFGVETVLDSQMTASSIADVQRSAFEARLNNPSPLFWQPSVSTSLDEWLKVDFLSVVEIASISTQGSSQGTARITAYRLEYNNDDSDLWIPYNFGEVLVGNVASASVVVTNQLIPFSAQFVRFRPVAITFATNLRLEYTFSNQVSPELMRSGLTFLDTKFNWGAWVRTNGTSGNGKVRLRTKFYEMILPIPAGYDSWEPQSYTVEVAPSGVNRRQSVFDFFPVRLRSEWLFEGTGVEYLLDRADKKTNGGAGRDLVDGAGPDPTLAGLQLSFASVDSVRWPRVDNADASQPNLANPDIHAWELWYRQPEFLPDQAAQCCLFRANNNTRHGVGRGGTSLKNFPAMHNNFNAVTDWESEVDLYGDNLPHQLIEAHSTVTDYVIYVDGMPVASGTNTGWIDNSRRFIINGEQSNGVDDLTRSGGDFGSLIEYKGGDRLTQIMVRRLYEASSLPVIVDAPAGLESGAVGDSQLTASSVFQTPVSPAHFARLNNAGGSWAPATNNITEWWKIDFGSIVTVKGISTQGSPLFGQWITTYKLEFNDDDGAWTPYNSDEILTGNGDQNTVVTNVLIPFTCRFLRVRQQTFSTYPNLRAEFEIETTRSLDMLTKPRWFILDSVNCTVSAAPAKDLICGAVENNTGARSGAIPRNGKVYFELEIVVQGDGTGTSNLGPRKLAEGSNVGDFPAVATDGYHTDGQGAIHDSDEVALVTGGVLGTAATGRIFQIAIDWRTGDWWMGSDDVSYLGIGGAGNPSTGANPLPALDVDFNWAMGMNILNQFGNNTVRLITADVDLNHPKPTGYVAWEDAI